MRTSLTVFTNARPLSCVDCSLPAARAQVAAGAADAYVRELTGIRALSASGAAQLAADLDYFCNVLGALGVALPLQLATWQVRRPVRCVRSFDQRGACSLCLHCLQHQQACVCQLGRATHNLSSCRCSSAALYPFPCSSP